MTASKRPLIAITMGDPAGIGPEIVVKALLWEDIVVLCRPLVVGSSLIMQNTMRSVGPSLKLHPVNVAAEAQGEPGTADIIDLDNLEPGDVVPGTIDATCGKAAMEYIAEAARLALGGEVDALVTAPINKEATRKAGYGELGHLDFLARLTGATECATMLVAGHLRVVHLTTHHSLRQACDFVTRERVLARLTLTHESLEKWGIDRPRIAVAALNPHAGEGGLLGSEEIEEIGPAITMARNSGLDAQGPFPADSVFTRAIRGEFDAVLAMYHDQGHIPVKVYSFDKTVSVALGLPFVRTSVDHGTAFDIAGRGIANPQSLIEAIRMAVALSRDNKLPDVSN